MEHWYLLDVTHIRGSFHMIIYRVRSNKNHSRRLLTTNVEGDRKNISLVGGWTNPSEKYDRQIGNIPQIGGENQKFFETTT